VQVEHEGRRLGLELAAVRVKRPDDLEQALATAAKGRPGALWVVPIGPVAARVRQVISFATAERLPTIFPSKFFAEAGGLMSYGFDRQHLVRRAASYVDRILKGANPSDLPIEEPTKYELVINLRTAKALGVTIPRSMLMRADQVIE
jgi:putative tryptophan/tyrosine transport system substrate-binding protein